jgi:hypothetical protein
MSIDYEKFIRSDYNTTINNVSSSVDSVLFRKINNRNPDILESVQIQDGKYYDPAYTNPRYEGSKSTSATYTIYTPGDQSYGKSAAIDSNTLKFAWANDINTVNLNFYDKSTITIKYLIDETGSLTELSNKNSNLFEVQNTFKKGDLVNVSLFDKKNPTNQASLDGNKLIYESGYRYFPIVFREANETLNYLYDEPTEEILVRLGIKSVNTDSLLFQTIGNADTDFTSSLGANTIFKKNGVVQTTNNISFNKFSNNQWPYPTEVPFYKPLTFKRRDNTTFQYIPIELSVFGLPQFNFYYTIDTYTPSNTSTVAGGYVTNDSLNSMKINTSGGEWYTYFQALRTSKYIANVKIPIKISYSSNPDSGPSVIKVVAVLEKQAAGTTGWSYVASSTLRADNIPPTSQIGIDEQNSCIYMDGTMPSANPYIQATCEISKNLGDLNESDKIRLRLYFADLVKFFYKTENIYFEIPAGDSSTNYFEIIDDGNSTTQPVLTAQITGTTDTPPYAIFQLVGTDNRTIEFNNDASKLYNKSTFVPPSADDPGSITNYYSSVEAPFTFKIGDIVRFGSYASIKPELYTISEINNPEVVEIGTYPNITKTVVKKLSIKLDRVVNSSRVNSRSFAILRKKEDETSVIIEFKKAPGKTSNALLIPYNLRTDINKNVGNIVGKIKDTILSKVLING